MKHSAPFMFKGESGASDSGKKVYSAIASTDALDRDREVLLPKGVVTENFMKNPVMLRIHDYRHVPVGKVRGIRVDDTSVKFDFEFADSNEGQELEKLYNDGYMNAFSVGLYPLDSKFIDEDTPDQMELEVADGSKMLFDLTKYKMRPRRVVNKWELLEISPVPVPSNPEALLLRAKDCVVRKFMKNHSEAEGQIFAEQLSEQMENASASIKSFLSSIEGDITIRKSVPKHSTPINTDKSWDNALARAALARYASSDGSGDKETMNWGKFAKGFGWVDNSKADTFTAYKFPHHTVIDGDLVAIWRGVTAAMASLLGAQSGTSILDSDKAGVYAHIAKHYEDAGKEVPPMDKTYSDEELKAIEEDQWEEFLKAEQAKNENAGSEGDTSDEDSKGSDDDQAVKQLITDALSGISGKMDEMDETLRLRVNILVGMLEELTDLVKSMKKSTEEDTSEADPDEGDAESDKDENEDKDQIDLAAKFNDLTGFLKASLSIQ
jgi:phage head maturation protease